jgi:uncharacterized protein YecT (DUF1311 family)
MRRYFPALLGILYLVAPLDGHAMDFRLYYQPKTKVKVVIGEGEITNGDADRFLTISRQADRDDEGHVIFVLNSPGGSVPAAFQLVAAMDKVGVYTLVPDNARCASACASVVFASGARRNVIGTGKLGFHSCYSVSGGLPAESSLCNEVIAQNAFERGLDHAAVNLFVNDYGATKMAWVGSDVACTWLRGLCKPTLKTPAPRRPVPKPSFDCAQMKTTVEKLICGDEELATLDRDMNKLYMTVRKESSDSKTLQSEQRAWLLNSRNVCADRLCLISSYRLRINELSHLGR